MRVKLWKAVGTYFSHVFLYSHKSRKDGWRWGLFAAIKQNGIWGDLKNYLHKQTTGGRGFFFFSQCHWEECSNYTLFTSCCRYWTSAWHLHFINALLEKEEELVCFIFQSSNSHRCTLIIWLEHGAAFGSLEILEKRTCRKYSETDQLDVCSVNYKQNICL